MEKDDDSHSPSWSASFFIQTKEDVARAVAAATTAASSVHSARPSVIYSSNDENSTSPLKKLHQQVSRVLKSFSQQPERNLNYNPELLTSQKRQWARFQMQHLDHKALKEPSRIFESMVVVGLPPNCDVEALQKRYLGRKSEGSGKFRSTLNCQQQSRVEPNLEPQVLFVYPPEKQLPLKYKDLLSFCLPGGVEVHAVERTPSMSELNEILLGQEHLKQSSLSFVFRLQVADDSTLYGCCVLVEEIVQKPSALISMVSEAQYSSPTLRRHVLTTHRCYCILSRLPFFELHFGVLNSLFSEERLEWLTKSIGVLDVESEDCSKHENSGVLYGEMEGGVKDVLNETIIVPQSNTSSHVQSDENENESDNPIHQHVEETNENCNLHHQVVEDINEGCNLHHQVAKEISESCDPHHQCNDVNHSEQCTVKVLGKAESEAGILTSEASYACVASVADFVANKQPMEKRFPSAVLPLFRHQQYESSESSSSFQGSPCEDRIFRSDIDDAETEETSFSGQGYSSDYNDILKWAKANNHGSLQIICEYYRLECPVRGSTIRFHPIEHLNPLEYHRPDDTTMHITGSRIDFNTCRTSLELAEAYSALGAEEEATALSVWAVACLCGSLRLEHVLTFFAGALLEKQIVVICSNLGLLSASVLSVIPLIRPFRWQSLLMLILPDDMLDFLDASVPYIASFLLLLGKKEEVGVKNKTIEVQSKLTNVIVVDANKNQVKSSQLPHQKELYSMLIPYHAKLVGESFLGRKRPIYGCIDVQWDESLDGVVDGSSERNVPRLPAPVMRFEMENFGRRRKMNRWSPLEEDTLKSGVEKYGKGNWKFILNVYKDSFNERTKIHHCWSTATIANLMQKIKDIEDEMAKTKKHNATSHHLGFLKVASCEFTTLTCIPGVITYRGDKIQVISTVQTCYCSLIVLDAIKPITHKHLILKELEASGIRSLKNFRKRIKLRPSIRKQMKSDFQNVEEVLDQQ